MLIGRKHAQKRASWTISEAVSVKRYFSRLIDLYFAKGLSRHDVPFERASFGFQQ